MDFPPSLTYLFRSYHYRTCFFYFTVMDNCMPNPCKNGGTCYEEGMDYTCTCSGNWFGQRCTDRKYR